MQPVKAGAPWLGSSHSQFSWRKITTSRASDDLFHVPLLCLTCNGRQEYKKNGTKSRERSHIRNMSVGMQIFEVPGLDSGISVINRVNKLDEEMENFNKELGTIRNNQMKVLKMIKGDEMCKTHTLLRESRSYK